MAIRAIYGEEPNDRNSEAFVWRVGEEGVTDILVRQDESGTWWACIYRGATCIARQNIRNTATILYED